MYQKIAKLVLSSVLVSIPKMFFPVLFPNATQRPSFNNSLKAVVRLDKFGINLEAYVIISKNVANAFVSCGLPISKIAFTFSLSTQIPASENSCPMYFISSTANLLFCKLNFTPYSLPHLRTCAKIFSCSSLVSAKIIMSSI